MLKGWVATEAGETLVLAEIQCQRVMRLDADGQVLERLNGVAQAGITLGDIIGRQLPLFIQPGSFRQKLLLQATFAASGEAFGRRVRFGEFHGIVSEKPNLFQFGDEMAVISSIEVCELQIAVRGNEVGLGGLELSEDLQGLFVMSRAPQQFPLVGENR